MSDSEWLYRQCLVEIRHGLYPFLVTTAFESGETLQRLGREINLKTDFENCPDVEPSEDSYKPG